MRVALMVPCYIDMFYPQVGKSTLELLERLGVEVEYPFDQTCCGQPMANSGAHTQAKATEELLVRNFAKSRSCRRASPTRSICRTAPVCTVLPERFSHPGQRRIEQAFCLQRAPRR